MATNQQPEQDRWSIDRQKQAIREAAYLHGFSELFSYEDSEQSSREEQAPTGKAEAARRTMIYARLAVEQEPGTSYDSLDTQIDTCKAYCEERGYHLQHVYQEGSIHA